MALHLAKAPVLTAVVLAGTALAAFYLLEKLIANNAKGSKGTPNTPAASVQLTTILLFLLAALAFASSIAWPVQVDPNDDVACYLSFPEKILQTGTLIEPFNVRRMGTYGGQALLQALVMIVGGEKNGHVPDRGFGMLLLFGMLLHLSRGIPKPLGMLRFLAVGCLFFVSIPRINTGSHLTGAAMILALILTLSKLPLAPRAGWTACLVPALLVAAAGSLRMTYLLCVAGIIALEPIIRHWTDFKSIVVALQKAFVCVFPVALGSSLILIPWMAVLWQSNGTPMYPPLLGTMNPEFTVLGNKGGAIFDVAHGLACLLTPEILVLLLCLGLTFFSTPHPLALATAWAAVLVSWYTSYKFGVTVLSEGYRYTFPMLMPVALWQLVSSINRDGNQADTPDIKGMIPAVLALALLLALNLPNAGRELGVQVESLPLQIVSRDRLVNPALTNADRELQNFTPRGSKIFAAVDTPYGFDFSRNVIYTADVPGASSSGTWPLRQGPQALEKHLVEQGFKYIIASDFDNAMLLYTRKHWNEHQRPEWYFKEIWGKYFLDFMDSVDSLAKTNRVVATAANLRLIELNTHSFP